MSDAAHMLSDVSAFLVSIFAAWAATQPSTAIYSFGYHRAEILGALVSVLIIWLVTGALVRAREAALAPAAAAAAVDAAPPTICFSARAGARLGMNSTTSPRAPVPLHPGV
jgi:divalent metal cation (Fe/Co/Zn/Cd) transporter